MTLLEKNPTFAERIINTLKPERILYTGMEYEAFTVQFTKPLTFYYFQNYLSLHNIRWNLEDAKKNDIKPLSLNDILNNNGQKITELDLPYIVFSDASDNNLGNTWRLTTIDKENATFQHCQRYGDSDTREILPITVSRDLPLFTKIMNQKFIYNNRRYSLQDWQYLTIRNININTKKHTEQIYWSSSTGELILEK